MILKSFWVKSHKFSRLTHRLLQMDPDDILWLMQSQRKCCSCEERIPSSCRGINTELLLWGAAGTSAMLPNSLPKKAICREQVLQTGALAAVPCHSAAADK